MPARVWAAIVGVIAAAVALAAAELVAVVVDPASSPLFAVGAVAIDLAPSPVKDAMIAVFGTGDKAALLVILAIVVVLLAAVAGLLEYRRRGLGAVVIVAVSVLAVIAAATRQGATGLSALPAVVGMLLGSWFLVVAAARLHRWRTTANASDGAMERRSFLLLTAVTAIVSVTVGVVGRAINAGGAAVASLRDMLMLPVPATPAPPVPAGAQLDVPGIGGYVTPNAEFYRIDTALQVPRIDPASWVLRIHGDVDQEVVLSFADLLALPLEEHLITLACVSNEVGGDLIGNALWLGYPIRELLTRARPSPGADMVLSTSQDGFTAGTPLSVLQDPAVAALLAVGMNGEPLPLEHGFPVRMVVPGLYGYVSATKWVVEMEVTRFDRARGYWIDRGWAERGPIKIESRIDVPAPGSTRQAGAVPIAGVAWAQRTGIARVEVRVDDGAWQDATLADTAGVDTWVQWLLLAELAAGRHSVSVRATDRNGRTQTEVEAPPAPDGASGWHTLSFTVA